MPDAAPQLSGICMPLACQAGARRLPDRRAIEPDCAEEAVGEGRKLAYGDPVFSPFGEGLDEGREVHGFAPEKFAPPKRADGGLRVGRYCGAIGSETVKKPHMIASAMCQVHSLEGLAGGDARRPRFG